MFASIMSNNDYWTCLLTFSVIVLASPLLQVGWY